MRRRNFTDKLSRGLGGAALLAAGLASLALVSCDDELPMFEAPRRGADGDSCVSADDCLSGFCNLAAGTCGLPDTGKSGVGGACTVANDCQSPLLCRDRVCTDTGAGGGEDGGEADPGVTADCPAPVGISCVDHADCGANGRCLADEGGFGFPGGYCTVDPNIHPECCPEGSERRDMAGGPRYCWLRCGTDSLCRTDEGYHCIQGSCGPTEEPPNPEDGGVLCADGKDNDGDDYVDCDDPDCEDENVCLDKVENTAERCSDSLDNDEDGLLDCRDLDCRATRACLPESQRIIVEATVAACSNGIDDDLDGAQDCADADCRGVCACAASGGVGDDEKVCEADDALCSDGEDNDNDGMNDCADPDCAGTPSCPQGTEVCNNGIDDDGDDLEDCHDLLDCNGVEPCPTLRPEGDLLTCTDNEDNDGDGFKDCLDSACIGIGSCGARVGETIEDCVTFIDGDGDGLIGCDDPDCAPPTQCNPCLCSHLCEAACGGLEASDDLCGDGLDNDGDDLLDCDDPECSQYAGCDVIVDNPRGEGAIGPDSCTDGADNDLDGRIDCYDTECQLEDHCFVGPGEGGLGDEFCSDGIDNDEDGVTDCADPQCNTVEDCVVVGGRESAAPDSCENGVDDDEDGLSDCEDPDCEQAPPCLEGAQ